MPPLLLDTCAAIWISGGVSVRDEAVRALAEAFERAVPVYVSPITAWEIAQLVAKGRLDLRVTPERWFARLLKVPGVALAGLPPAVLIASCFLPGAPPRDPSDRIMAATARDTGATLVTRDGLLLDYARQGHIAALPC